MARTTGHRVRGIAFGTVTAAGLRLPGVEVTKKYDGSPVLKLGVCRRSIRSDGCARPSRTRPSLCSVWGAYQPVATT